MDFDVIGCGSISRLGYTLALLSTAYTLGKATLCGIRSYTCHPFCVVGSMPGALSGFPRSHCLSQSETTSQSDEESQ